MIDKKGHDSTSLIPDVYKRQELKHFEGKKAVVCVGGGSMKRFGFLDRAVGYLKEAHPLLAHHRAGAPRRTDTAARHRADSRRTVAAPQVLRRGTPRARTRGLRHQIRQPLR